MTFYQAYDLIHTNDFIKIILMSYDQLRNSKTLPRKKRRWRIIANAHFYNRGSKFNT